MSEVAARRTTGDDPDARRLVAAMTAEASDTGAKQPGAQRLYERAGYRAIPDFNGDAHAAWWGEKPLSRP